MSHVKMNFFFEMLACPFCKQRFQPVYWVNTQRDGIYGILKCKCHQYPVIADIPILKRDAQRYIPLIKSGHAEYALYRLLVPPHELDKLVVNRLLSCIPSLSFIKGIKYRLQCKLEKSDIARIKEQTIGNIDGKTCLDYFTYYFTHHFNCIDAYNYFAFRFGLPRHLVALSLAQVLKDLQGPVLDLACGFGHLTRSLANNHNAEESPVIGLDSNFFTLYVAKKRLSPDAKFVCSDASRSLPFNNHFFSAVLCVDGLHYFHNKAALIKEMNRVSRDGARYLLASIRTKALNEFHGFPISSSACSELFNSIPHCILNDNEIVQRYLKKTGPDLSTSIETGTAEDPHLISVVASQDKTIFKEHQTFEKWPHANGCLKINPLYKIQPKTETDDMALVLDFPKGVYEQENSACLTYLPREVKLGRKTLMEMEKGMDSSEINRLVEKLVIIGMPERYY